MVHIIVHIYCASYSHSTKTYISLQILIETRKMLFFIISISMELYNFNKYGVIHVDKLYTASKVYHSEDAEFSPRARMGRDKFRRMECES